MNLLLRRFGYRRNLFLLAFSAIAAIMLVTTGPASASHGGSVVIDPVTGHSYEYVAGPLNWDDAKAAAAALTHNGFTGHLATITSAAETAFIVANVPDAVVFRTNQGPFEGGAYIGAFQPAGSVEPGGGWKWVTGEPFAYTNWAGGEPNNSGGENVAHFFNTSGGWNDAADTLLKGYLVEFDTPPNSPPVIDVDVNTDNTVNYVDWTAANAGAGTASGVIHLPNGQTVGVTFEALASDGITPSFFFFAQTDGTGTDFWNTPSTPYISTEVPNAPPDSDVLALTGGNGDTYRITFSESIVDPIMAILSLGQQNLPTTYDFDSPFTIVSQGVGHFGGCSTCLTQQSGDRLVGNEGHGTIKFLGTVSTFSWTVPTAEVWHGFTFAVRTTTALENASIVEEGQTATNTGTWSDPDTGEVVTLSASVGTIVKNVDGTWDWSLATTDGPTESQTVTVTATDSHGATDTDTFELIVKNVAPTVSAVNDGPVFVNNPATVTVTATDPAGAADPLMYEFDFDNNGGFEVGPQAGNSAPHTYTTGGDKTVTVRVTDGDGGSTTATTLVTVIPNQPPVANAGPDQTVEATSAAGADVALDGSGSSDPDGDPLTYTWSESATVIAGGVSPVATLGLGTHTVTLEVDDGNGETDTDDVLITVEDTTAPALTAPAAVIVEGNVTGGATGVSLGTATAIDIVDPSPVITNDAPAFFPLGQTTVIWTAKDTFGNQASVTQDVTVIDSTAPVMQAGAPLVVEGNTTGGATGVSLGTATAIDIVDPSPVITNDAPLFFPLGLTTVTWTGTDASGNSASVTQDVTVVDTTAPDVTAALVPVTSGDDDDDDGDGLFTVVFSSSDTVDPDPTVSATINGVPVTNGQVVKLVLSNGKPKVKPAHKNKPLKIKDSAIELVVTSTDASGNQGAATASPVFPPDDDEDDDDDDDHGDHHGHGDDDHGHGHDDDHGHGDDDDDHDD